MQLNTKARVILSKDAFNDYYLKILGLFNYKIGLNKELLSCKQIELVEGIVHIDNELTLFGEITSKKFLPNGNNKLFKKIEGKYYKDDFTHEINLIINEDSNMTLFCGCAHNGIINIIEKAKLIADKNIDYVIGGMHLYNLKITKREDISCLNELLPVLDEMGITKYYTCHCTGEKVYKYLKNKLEDRISELKTGMTIEV